MSPQPTSIAIDGSSPEVDASAWVAPNATLIGAVTLGADSGVFYTAVVRADQAPITIGAGSNLQDGVVVHADPAFPATIGSGVSVGHRAVLHGCTVEDTCLIGMGAIVLNGAVIGTGSLVAAGAVVLEGTVIPPHSLVAGVPGKVRRQLTDDEHQKVVLNATHYVGLTRAHRDALAG
ncbi:gamma carbonic anhydrase family protein [Nakamurella leprariae]|uniref:Gamma carbonic anhydrase family protein n=1 Tax=Nakamurella leprariae TaxID=2803911 RepID=A0A938YHP0_9ACTN|nr:gamma carbonic anhydrase family protein [Nakamurella leprariae]MBM9468018.1 gamma carbonic anhydrase family protein [Nakamurella leprariae]